MTRPLITITSARFDEAEVRFAYDAHAVEVIKRAPVRHWDKDAGCWRVPAEHAGLIAELFRGAGYEVRHPLGARAWAPGQRLPAEPEPVAALLAIVPEHLRTPTVRALAKVWHPDVGGDHALMQRLNTAADGLAR